MTTDQDAVTTGDDAHGLDVVAVIAIQVIVAVSVWGFLGLVVDLLAGTGPWAQFVGVVVGTLVALVLAQRRALEPPGGEPSHD